MRYLATIFLFFCLAGDVSGQNRLTYLDEFCDPYYVGGEFPKLTTPQWVGDEKVEAVIVLSIDDMRGFGKWETYLRPIIDRLKKIDGRAPVSIMTNRIDPKERHLQTWLKEGLSIEVHTIDHPCPCLQGGDFNKASKTYHDCVDLMAEIPANKPVAFRMPCCDSMNTPSPRFFSEVFNRKSKVGNFLRIDSSVFNVATPADKSLPREWLVDEKGDSRFRRYLPFPSFVNTIENYPYPYVIGRKCWQFPCVVPSDWEAQHVQKPNNPATVADMKLALDITVAKKGVFTFVFHPHGWIRNDQVVEFIDYAAKKYGDRVKFLNFQECADRLQTNLLAKQPLRNAAGDDNGVRILDLNADGFLDVVIGNEHTKTTRVWSPEENKWQESAFPTIIAAKGIDRGVRFGQLSKSKNASFIVKNEKTVGVWHFTDKGWKPDDRMLAGLKILDREVITSRGGVDQGARLRDLNGDGISELIAGGPLWQAIFQWNETETRWQSLPFALPANTFITDARGNDAGLRFVDINGDHQDDVIFSNGELWAAHLFVDVKTGWSKGVTSKRPDDSFIPPIVRGVTNNGAWIHSRKMWVQNEDTARLPDKVDRMSLAELAKRIEKEANKKGDPQATFPAPKSPRDALKTFQTKPNFEIQLVAAEPLVQDPVAFDWAADGSLWVVEMGDYPSGAKGEQGKAGGRVKRLVDTNNDGRYDKATLFLEGLPFPTGIKVWRDGVLVTAAPTIMFARDTTNDGQADNVQTLFEGFREGNQQHRVNGLRFGLDNWLYLANGDSGGTIRSTKTGDTIEMGRRDLRINIETGEMQAITGTTQFGRNRDDWGNWFGGNNSHPVWHYALQENYLARNPHFSPPAAKREIAAQPGAARVFPTSRTLERFNNPHSANRFTSACSPTFYRAELLGKQYVGNVFVCEPVHNMVHREVVSATGSTFRSTRADDEQSSEFLTSSDSWFRPTMARTGPDGALWVADMYRLVIEHPEWIPQRFQNTYDLQAGSDRGRIYRIVPKGSSPKIPDFQNDDITQLVAKLSSTNGVVRDMAQQMILWEKDERAPVLLQEVVAHGESPLGRLHAMCSLQGLNALDATTAKIALADKHPGVRRHAVRIAESLVDTAPDLIHAIVPLANDSDPFVRKQLAYSVGQWKSSPVAGEIIATLLSNPKADQYEIAAVMSSLNRENVGHVLTILLKQSKTNQETIAEILNQAVALGASDSLAPALHSLTTPNSRGSFAVWQLQSTARLLAHNESSLKLVLEKAGPKIKAMATFARQSAMNNKAPTNERIASLAFLTVCPGEFQLGRSELLSLIEPTNEAMLQTAAIDSIGDAATLSALLAKWRELTPNLRSRVFELLVARQSNINALQSALKAKLLTPRNLNASQRQLLIHHADTNVRKLAEQWSQSSTKSARAELVARYQAAISKRGDSEKGAKLFTKHCAACHRLGKTGTHIGPNLAALTNRTTGHLLTSILDPNRAVEDKFLSYHAVTDNGKIYAGMLESEVGSSLTLRTAKGEAVRLLRSQLEEFHSTGKSFMPEGFELDLKPANVNDIIAFVQSSGAPPKSFPGNRPAVVRPDESGVLHLSASTAEIRGSRMVFEEKHQNLGWWFAEDDSAEWQFAGMKPQPYMVAIHYASPNESAGAAFVISIDDAKLNHQVVGTGSWEKYQWRDVGKIQVTKEDSELSIRALGNPNGPVLDLKAVRLTPVKR